MPDRRRREVGITLVELLVVIGLIAVLASLLLPVLGKARAAANASICLANLRQVGSSWTMYLSDSRGRLPEYVWSTPTAPSLAWQGYWTGVVDRFETKDGVLVCPTARLESPFTSGTQRGYGTVSHSWSGRSLTSGCGVKFNSSKYRMGSYAYNRYLTVDTTLTDNVDRLALLRDPSQTPAFLDATFADIRPRNQSAAVPVTAPPDLTGGSVSAASPEHWRMLIDRHAHAINVCMADGSARRVPLEELYQLRWTTNWNRYQLDLPAH